MAIILSCGHESKSTYDYYTIICKDIDIKNRRAIAYRSVCIKCKMNYVNSDNIFVNEDDAIEWIFEDIRQINNKPL
jgi:hypothetical protein